MIDKIIEELECECEKYHDFAEEDFNLEYWERYEVYKEAIEIVKKYDNDGWIDVEDELPPNSGLYFVTQYDKDSINENCDGYRMSTIFYDDNGWWDDIDYDFGWRIIAWRELPSPYIIK